MKWMLLLGVCCLAILSSAHIRVPQFFAIGGEDVPDAIASDLHGGDQCAWYQRLPCSKGNCPNTPGGDGSEAYKAVQACGDFRIMPTTNSKYVWCEFSGTCKNVFTNA